MTSKLDKEDLARLYNEADSLYQELSAFSDRLFDSGLKETGSIQGVEDALGCLSRAMNDLDRRIRFTDLATK